MRKPTLERRPDGKVPCSVCGVGVAPANVDYHVSNAHNRAQAAPPTAIPLATPTTSAPTAAAAAVEQPTVGADGKSPCENCGARVAPANMAYHVSNAHRQAAPLTARPPSGGGDPVRESQSTGLRLAKAVGWLLLGWLVIGTVLGLAASFAAPGAEYYMPAVGFVIGLGLAVRSWLHTGRPARAA